MTGGLFCPLINITNQYCENFNLWIWQLNTEFKIHGYQWKVHQSPDVLVSWVHSKAHLYSLASLLRRGWAELDRLSCSPFALCCDFNLLDSCLGHRISTCTYILDNGKAKFCNQRVIGQRWWTGKWAQSTLTWQRWLLSYGARPGSHCNLVHGVTVPFRLPQPPYRHDDGGAAAPYLSD